MRQRENKKVSQLIKAAREYQDLQEQLDEPLPVVQVTEESTETETEITSGINLIG